MSNFTGNQKAVVEHEKGNLLVSASAGSGKTFTMISRAIRLIKEKKTKVSNVLALTFTEAAALEMKEKLKKALFNLIANGGEEFTEQISDLDCADISTLHAFCGRIIRAYFFTCGVSPDFKILDADEALLIQKNAIDGLFRKLYESKEPFFLNLLSIFRVNRKDDNLKELVIKLYESAMVEPDFDEMLDKFSLIYTPSGLDQAILKIKEYYNARANVILDELAWAKDVFSSGDRFTAVEVTNRLFEDVLDSVNGDYYNLSKFIDYKLSFMPSPFGSKLNELEATAREIVKGAKDKFIALIKRFTKDICDKETYLSRLGELNSLSRDLSALTKAFKEHYSELKREENALDFSDLEHYAVKVLQDENARQEIKEKYDYIFVDEYQDTNSVQELIVSLVANDNLFMVGDDKQSIYGFRGCKPEIFLNKEKDLQSNGGKALRLNHNFRSARNVINAVNSIFSYCMTDEHYGYSYLKKAMLVFGETYPDGAEGRAELHILDTSLSVKEKKEKESVKVYDLKAECFRALEEKEEDVDVEEVSLLIADIIENEYKKEYFDVKDNEFKPVTPNDVVILSRSVETTYVQRLVSSLYRLGIPVNSKVSVNALEFPEVKTLVKFLELLENGRLDLPLITVMKSVIGDFSDEDLYDVASLYYNGVDGKDRKNGGFFDAYVYAINHADGALQEKLVRFDNYIKECRLLKDFIGAKGILDKVVSDTGYFNAILTLKEGRTISQVVEYFISKSVLGDKILTTFEFLEKIRLSDKAFRVETSVGEQAVRIMTIHASKGLEFPVVIAVGLEKKSNVSDEEKEILFSKENGFITKFYNTNTMLKEETPFRLLTKEQIRENRLKEELRLFYVALTRASYSLHMVAKCKGDPRTQTFAGGERYIDYVPQSFPVSIRTAEEFSFEAVKYEARKILVGKVNEERKEIIRKNIEFSYPHLLDVFVPLKTSVTSTLCLEDKTHLDDNDVLDNGTIISVGAIEEDGTLKGQTGKERGTIAHKILELYDFEKGNLPIQVEEMVKNSLLTDEEVASVDVLRLNRALNEEIISVIKGKKLYKEAPFFANFKASEILDTASIEPVLVQGIIDLLAVGDEDCVIIDYKYSTLNKEKLKEKYNKQLRLYSLAVERVLGVKVKDTYLLNIYSGDVIKL